LKTRLLMVPLLALVTLASTPAGSVAHADDTRSTATAPTTLRLRGIVKKYDAATRMLSLTTADGAVQILVAPAVRIRHGWTEIDAGELAKLAGYRAAVRYSESGGNRTAESIHVFGRTERTER
jgi:hypothetical protein